MTYLASDSLEGRATGAPGYELAGGYVVERMRPIGLEPAGEDGWFQRFVVRQAASIARGNEQFELQPTADKGGLGAPVDGDGIYNDALLSVEPSIDAQAVFDEFLARHYHEVSDNTDLRIHWEAVASLARINARICLEIANAGERPAWLPDSFFGRRLPGNAGK